MDYVMAHHGVKGMKWGVRRYQYADGSLTPSGRKRYAPEGNSRGNVLKRNTSELLKKTATAATGRQYVDTVLEKGTTFSRIQTSKNFENFAFYATYKKSDIDKYMGLFGKNLKSRAEGDARRAEESLKNKNDKKSVNELKELRDRAKNVKVYQLKIETVKKLRVPSDANASDITHNLLKDKTFKENLSKSIEDSKTKMKRPTQQMLFDRALKALNKNLDKMTSEDKKSIYKAFNLSLTNHNDYEIAAQNRFYKELKKKGYDALLDYNDKDYSSYHAKRPMIVFNNDAVKLKAVTETNPKVVDSLYRKYNTERILKETASNTIGLLSRIGTQSVSDCTSYVDKKMDDYLNDRKAKGR